MLSGLLFRSPRGMFGLSILVEFIVKAENGCSKQQELRHEHGSFGYNVMKLRKVDGIESEYDCRHEWRDSHVFLYIASMKHNLIIKAAAAGTAAA